MYHCTHRTPLYRKGSSNLQNNLILNNVRNFFFVNVNYSKCFNNSAIKIQITIDNKNATE